MKYKRKLKRRITSGALAITLFVGGSSSAYAAHIQGSAQTQSGAQTVGQHRMRGGQNGQTHDFLGLGLNHNRAIGEIVAVTSTGFTLEVHNPKHNSKAQRGTTGAAPAMVPFDIKTTASTIYQKDGAAATAVDIAVGQKAVVVGTIDSTAQIITAEKINIVTKIPDRGAKKR